MSDIFYTVPVSCIIVGLLIFVAFGLCTFGVVQEKLPCIGCGFFIVSTFFKSRHTVFHVLKHWLDHENKVFYLTLIEHAVLEHAVVSHHKFAYTS